MLGVVGVAFVLAGSASSIRSDESYPHCARADDAEVARFARSGRRPRELVVAASDRGLRRLARSRVLRRVERLTVCGDDAGLRALVGSRHLRRLEELTVVSDDFALDPETITAIGSSPRLRRTLRVLHLYASDSESDQTVGGDGADALIADFDLPGVRRLDLSFNHLTEDHVIALVRAPWAAQLEHLLLCETALGRAATDALIDERDRLSRLTDLCISSGGRGGNEDYRRLQLAYGDVFRHHWDEE